MTAKAKYSDRRWRSLRRRFLRVNPICMDPAGCDELATDVHHLDGQGLAGPRGYDWTNLEALCHSHHSQRTAREQPGGWARAQRARARAAEPHPGLVVDGGGGHPLPGRHAGRGA